MKFNNKPNPKIKTQDGDTIHLARSCAVVGEVFLYSIPHQQWYALLGKRGTSVPNFQGYWGFPCGYLDWDERLDEAIIREIWEETGLYLKDSHFIHQIAKSYNLPDGNNPQSKFWKVIDQPNDDKQNISFHFGFIFSWNSTTLPLLSIQNAFRNEAESANWITIEEAGNLQLAFNHNARLDEILNKKKHHFDNISNVSTIS